MHKTYASLPPVKGSTEVFMDRGKWCNYNHTMTESEIVGAVVISILHLRKTSMRRPGNLAVDTQILCNTDWLTWKLRPVTVLLEFEEATEFVQVVGVQSIMLTFLVVLLLRFPRGVWGICEYWMHCLRERRNWICPLLPNSVVVCLLTTSPAPQHTHTHTHNLLLANFLNISWVWTA